MRRLYRNGPPAACIRVRTAALSGEFGRDLAARWFGLTPEQQAEKFGQYKSGPRKGLTRGYAVWIDVSQGGWVREYGVVRPGLRLGMLADNDTKDRIMLMTTREALGFIPHLPETGPVNATGGEAKT